MKLKALLIASALVTFAQTQVVVFNDTFETPAMALGTFQYSPAWSWTSTGAGIVTNGGGFDLPLGVAQEGTQAAFVQSAGTISRSLTISGGNADTYTLSFYYAGRSGANGNESFRFVLDGTTLYTGASVSSQNWTFVTTDFVKTAGTYNFSIEGLTTPPADETAFFDVVQITAAVPEPASWFLLVGGFFFCCGIFRSQKNRIERGLLSSSLAS